jgi:hypothetical protein
MERELGKIGVPRVKIQPRNQLESIRIGKSTIIGAVWDARERQKGSRAGSGSVMSLRARGVWCLARLRIWLSLITSKTLEVRKGQIRLILGMV